MKDIIHYDYQTDLQTIISKYWSQVNCLIKAIMM